MRSTSSAKRKENVKINNLDHRAKASRKKTPRTYRIDSGSHLRVNKWRFEIEAAKEEA